MEVREVSCGTCTRDAVCGGNGTGGGTKIDIGGNGNGGVEAWGCEALAGITVAVVVP